jgi:hypothetical protein
VFAAALAMMCRPAPLVTGAIVLLAAAVDTLTRRRADAHA